MLLENHARVTSHVELSRFDEDFSDRQFKKANGKDTVEVLEALQILQSYKPRIEQLMFDGPDFRDLLDEPCYEDSQCPCCEHDLTELGVCPRCRYPDVRDDEVCLMSHVTQHDFAKMVNLKTRRPGIATSDAGTALNGTYCSVIIKKWEMDEILIKASLPKGYFD